MNELVMIDGEEFVLAGPETPCPHCGESKLGSFTWDEDDDSLVKCLTCGIDFRAKTDGAMPPRAVRYNRLILYLRGRGVSLTERQREVAERICELMEGLSVGEGKTMLLEALFRSDK